MSSAKGDAKGKVEEVKEKAGGVAQQVKEKAGSALEDEGRRAEDIPQEELEGKGVEQSLHQAEVSPFWE